MTDQNRPARLQRERETVTKKRSFLLDDTDQQRLDRIAKTYAPEMLGREPTHSLVVSIAITALDALVNVGELPLIAPLRERARTSVRHGP